MVTFCEVVRAAMATRARMARARRRRRRQSRSGGHRASRGGLRELALPLVDREPVHAELVRRCTHAVRCCVLGTHDRDQRQLGGAESASAPAATSGREAFFDHPGIAIFVSAGDDGPNDQLAAPPIPRGPLGPVARIIPADRLRRSGVARARRGHADVGPDSGRAVLAPHVRLSRETSQVRAAASRLHDVLA